MIVVEPKQKDLGEFTVKRVLPGANRRMVGPFVFFDHAGPAEFPPGEGIQVRPHPHIGLATITYLFEGEIIHRDSLGSVQPIRAGAVNLMVAGRGIVHSERAGEDLDTTSHLHAIQSWMALPKELEETEPEFIHYPAEDIPEVQVGDTAIRVIMGSAFDAVSPVKTFTPMLYLECRMPAGSHFNLPADWQELAIYVVDGTLGCQGETVDRELMVVAEPGHGLAVDAVTDCHLMVVGGDSLGERHVWWNFVSSSRERIERGKTDWREGRFDSVPGETEFIPLPD